MIIFEDTKEQGNKVQIKATARILSGLSAFVSDVSSYGVTELAGKLGMTKNMVYRALTTLAEHGYLVRDPSGQRYQLGYRILELQNHHIPEPDLRALCQPFTRRLQETTGETVSLIVRTSDYAVMIDGIETRQPGTYRMVLGTLYPLHVPASGLAILAFSSDEEIAGYIERASRQTDPAQEPLRPKELLARITEIRARGYAEVSHQGALPMLSIAFPIWASGGTLHGALGTGGPTERFGPKLSGMLPSIQDMLEELRQRTRLYPADPRQWAIS